MEGNVPSVRARRVNPPIEPGERVEVIDGRESEKGIAGKDLRVPQGQLPKAFEGSLYPMLPRIERVRDIGAGPKEKAIRMKKHLAHEDDALGGIQKTEKKKS